jgi:tRNA pseudouridine55 synthase
VYASPQEKHTRQYLAHGGRECMTMRSQTPVDGVLLVDKPEGLTSAGVVRAVKKILNAKKIGHLGTLDPFASGLLPLCVGAATKIAQFLMAEHKAYSGTIRLGIETDTLDVTGAVTRTMDVPGWESSALRDLEQRFSGECWQTPPMYSALKRNGVPLYKLARQGLEVERTPRKVFIDRLTLTLDGPETLSFSVFCSKGTYVRSLAADMGAALGCGAHLLSLRRTAFGPFEVSEAIPLPRASEQYAPATMPLLSLSQALRHYPAVQVSAAVVEELRHGQQATLCSLPDLQGERKPMQLLSPHGELVAMAVHSEGRWRLARVVEPLQ